jgi:hypothetical protein
MQYTPAARVAFALSAAALVLTLSSCSTSPDPNATCTDGQLTAAVRSGPGGSLGGNEIQGISIKNTSARQCRVSGYANIVAVGTRLADNGTRLSVPAPLTTLVRQGAVDTRSDPGVRIITLPPQTEAVFYVESGGAGGTGESAFVITQLNITVPGTKRPLDVAIPYPGLSASAASDQPVDMTITALGLN